ncbi:MAG: alpha/beta fold hydrolase [Runella sp.]
MNLFFRQIGTGRPMVILHGLFGSSDNWLTISKTIAEAGFSVYLLDLRNHGRSPHTDEHSYPLMAQDVLAFFEQQNLEKPILVGHSMGGKVAMTLAMQQPDVLEKLVVVDIAPKNYPVHHTDIIAGLQAIPLATLQNRTEADQILAQHEPHPTVRQFLLKNLYRNDQNQFAWRINLPVLAANIEAIGEGFDTPQIIKTPTLFIRGKRSHYVQDEDLPTIEALFPNLKIDTIADAGHWVQAEQPEAFVESLMQFL